MFVLVDVHVKPVVTACVRRRGFWEVINVRVVEVVADIRLLARVGRQLLAHGVAPHAAGRAVVVKGTLGVDAKLRLGGRFSLRAGSSVPLAGWRTSGTQKPETFATGSQSSSQYRSISSPVRLYSALADPLPEAGSPSSSTLGRIIV